MISGTYSQSSTNLDTSIYVGWFTGESDTFILHTRKVFPETLDYPDIEIIDPGATFSPQFRLFSSLSDTVICVIYLRDDTLFINGEFRVFFLTPTSTNHSSFSSSVPDAWMPIILRTHNGYLSVWTSGPLGYGGYLYSRYHSETWEHFSFKNIPGALSLEPVTFDFSSDLVDTFMLFSELWSSEEGPFHIYKVEIESDSFLPATQIFTFDSFQWPLSVCSKGDLKSVIVLEDTIPSSGLPRYLYYYLYFINSEDSLYRCLIDSIAIPAPYSYLSAATWPINDSLVYASTINRRSWTEKGFNHILVSFPSFEIDTDWMEVSPGSYYLSLKKVYAISEYELKLHFNNGAHYYMIGNILPDKINEINQNTRHNIFYSIQAISFNGRWRIELQPNKQIEEIEVFNILGKQIPFSISRNDNFIDVEIINKMSGLYFVVLLSKEGQTLSNKVICITK